ncbi:hypothetical protein [Pseudonocardia hierapolitana]|uniref:hypothetical protein n=1 Tax=Pseudonocardia hierapolitana TaxID=1128676 RepID=UPI0011BD9132|nr:hypothetical protein [Pseudonocardia hierapolitana]
MLLERDLDGELAFEDEVVLVELVGVDARAGATRPDFHVVDDRAVRAGLGVGERLHPQTGQRLGQGGPIDPAHGTPAVGPVLNRHIGGRVDHDRDLRRGDGAE